jgi:hypothetical protein
MMPTRGGAPIQVFDLLEKKQCAAARPRRRIALSRHPPQDVILLDEVVPERGDPVPRLGRPAPPSAELRSTVQRGAISATVITIGAW